MSEARLMCRSPTPSFVEATWIMVVKSLVIFAVIFGILPLLTVLERKLIGRFQHRYGPNRVGPVGLMQPIADVGKLISKESFRPENAVSTLFVLGPLLPVLAGVLSLAILPWGDVHAGVGFYGIDVPSASSTSSPSARSRSTACCSAAAVGLQIQLLGGDAVGGAADLVRGLDGAGAARRGDDDRVALPRLIVHSQGQIWYVIPQFVGFLVFMVAGFAETNRAPFDMPEADAELVQGFVTEYGGCATAPTPWRSTSRSSSSAAVAARCSSGRMGPGPGFLAPIWMLVEDFVFLLLFIWIRATLPRFRYYQLMTLGWKVLLPLATLNVLVTAILVVVT